MKAPVRSARSAGAMSTKTQTPTTHAARRLSARRTALFAYAAGTTAVLANLLLVAFYAIQASHPEDGTSLGSASDLVGSLSTAFMIPVALVLAGRLSGRRFARITRGIGVSAMAVLTVGGPLLVLGVLAFEVQAPIMVAAWMILCVWLLLVNRWSRLSGTLRPRLAHFGEFVGACTLSGGAVIGLGLFLPWMSWPQLIFFGVGGVLGLIGWFCIPLWFLLLGRHLAAPR